MPEADRGPSPYWWLCLVAKLSKSWRMSMLKADSPWLRWFRESMLEGDRVYWCLKLRVSTIETDRDGLASINARSWLIHLGDYQCSKLIESWKYRLFKPSPQLRRSPGTVYQHVFLLMLLSRGSVLAVGAKEGLVLHKHRENLPARGYFPCLAPKAAHKANGGWWLLACSWCWCWHARENFAALVKAFKSL